MIKRIVLCLMAGLFASSANAQEAATGNDPHGITIGERHSLASESLGEERAYWVHLPASYHDSTYAPQRYPVLYLLDGGRYFHSVSGVVRFMSTAIYGNIQIPEMIVVAIPNTNRTRDLTPTQSKIGFDGKEAAFLEGSGGGQTFLQFIRDELFPEVESTYRTLPHRVLVGHSFGGLLALDALLESPEMFQSYVAIDPSLWWDDREVIRRAENEFRNARERRSSVYISLANNSDLGFGDPMAQEEAGRTFAKSLEAAASPGFRSTLEYFEEEDHNSVLLLSLYHGLLYVFEGYKPSFGDFLEQPAALKTHFDGISERLGVALPPPPAYVNQLGYTLLYQIQDVDKAIEVFRLNVSYYPESSNAYDSLGEAYMVKGDELSAVEHFEKSLELNPDNENGKRRLEELRTRQDQR